MKKIITLIALLATALYGAEQLYSVKVPQVFTYSQGKPQYIDRYVNPVSGSLGLFGIGTDTVPVRWALGSTLSVSNGTLDATGITGTIPISSVSGLGTGVATALAAAVNTTGGPLTSGGSGGSYTFANTGLKLLDTDASHALSLVPGSNLTANRTLTVTTGDADRTLTLNGNATLNQDTSTAGIPTFAGLALTGNINVGANSYQWDQAGVRSWSVSASGGNLNFASGDSVGTFAFGGPFSVTGNITGTGVYSTTTASAANVFVDAAGLLQRSTSSIRYKRDVRDYTRGLADVMKLRPVLYKGKAKSDGDTDFAGFIAEEVDAAGLTEFVVYNDVLSDTETVQVLQPDGKIVEKPKVIATHQPDALAYANMVALLTKAIQELKADNDALAARVAALEAK